MSLGVVEGEGSRVCGLQREEVCSEGSDMECDDSLVLDQHDSEMGELHVQIDQTDTLDYKDPLLWDDLEMDVGEIG